AAGEPRIFEFARSFRNRERTPLHHPEFTLLEWYRAGAPYESLMKDCCAVIREAALAAGVNQLSFRDRSADPFVEPERLTVAEAFARLAGVDFFATLPATAADGEALGRAAQKAGVRIAEDDSWSDIFSRILVERVEPNLGLGRATILDEYPATLSALAKSA